MKKGILILGILAVIIAPVVLSAEDARDDDPLMGAVEFGSQESPILVWKSGRIDYINDTGMVVDDAGYQFAENIKCFSNSGLRLTRHNFFPGTRVKFVLKQDLITVISLVKQ